MDRDTDIRRLRFRAWHRGTREADYMIGGFFDRHHGDWDNDQMALFGALLEENDVDIMAWAVGTEPVPDAYLGDMMTAMQKLDYIDIAR